MTSPQLVLGVDVGGSGIKAAPVDVAAGVLVEERRKVATPQPATPAAVTEAVAGLVDGFGWDGTVGVAFPAVVTGGTTRTAANVDPAWVDHEACRALSARLGHPVGMLNDADAAGLAEMRFGAGRGRGGTVLMLTLGTGIGSALFTEGVLVRNTELGHLEVRGEDAEHRAAASVRTREDLGWEEWAARLDEYLAHVERLLWPDLVVVGGGISRESQRFFGLLHTRAEIVAAQMHNEAGIVGAALAIAEGTTATTGG